MRAKLWILLGVLLTLVFTMFVTPYLITTGNTFLSREGTLSFFLLLEFLGASFIINEFNRLRILINEKEAAEDQLNIIEKEIKKISSFKPSSSGMKGIVLAGGTATRLFPLTAMTSKQLLPVYDKPMIFYPLNTLIKAGIRDILVIVSPEHSGQFLNLLGSIFKAHGVRLFFDVQKVPRGLAEAFILGESFIGEDNVAMILGDNIFEDDFSEAIRSFKSGGHIFAKKVPDPERYGIVKFDESGKAVEIVEKPKTWISDYAIPGLYIYDNRVAKAARNTKPSKRGEIEITSLHNFYLEKGELQVSAFEGEWLDAGTFDSLLEAGRIVKEKKITENFHPLIIEAIEEFNEELKHRTKGTLHAHNFYLREKEK